MSEIEALFRLLGQPAGARRTRCADLHRAHRWCSGSRCAAISGQLGVADVLFIVLIADASQNGMAGEYRSLADAAVLLGTLVACNVALDWAIYRWPAMQRLMFAPTVELIRDGKILRRNLKREWVTVDELMGKLREAGIADVADVKLAMLEADGQLSVLKAQGSVQPTDPAIHATAGKHIGENSRA